MNLAGETVLVRCPHVLDLSWSVAWGHLTVREFLECDTGDLIVYVEDE